MSCSNIKYNKIVRFLLVIKIGHVFSVLQIKNKNYYDNHVDGLLSNENEDEEML